MAQTISASVLQYSTRHSACWSWRSGSGGKEAAGRDSESDSYCLSLVNLPLAYHTLTFLLEQNQCVCDIRTHRTSLYLTVFPKHPNQHVLETDQLFRTREWGFAIRICPTRTRPRWPKSRRAIEWTKRSKSLNPRKSKLSSSFF